MLALLRIVWLCVLVGGVGFWAYSSRHAIDPALHDRYSRDLRRVQAVDVTLNEYVLKSRLGLVLHYDPLVRHTARLEQLYESLAAVPAFLPPEARAEVSARLIASVHALRDKEALVERFKTEYAVLRNSVRYFPVAAGELVARVAARPDGQILAARLNELLSDVLLFNVVPGPEQVPRIVARIEALRALGADASPEDAAQLAVVCNHARVILERKPRVDALVDQIVALPTARRAAQLDAAYAGHYQRAIDAAARDRYALFLLALLFVGASALYIILRLDRSARALRAATDELSNVNAALRRERERERELSELKSRFVSMMSHEFRSPLSVVLSSSEMLEAYAERWPEAKKRDHHGRIGAAVRSMTQMLDNILTFGRADAGRLTFEPAAVELVPLCDAIVEEVRAGARAGQTVAFVPHGEWAAPVRMDPRLLRHVLTNLLANAVKYSPEGGPVTLELWREPAAVDARAAAAADTSGEHVASGGEGGERGTVGHHGDDDGETRREVARFEVRDEGIGIPPEDQARLFESFHRGRNVGSIAGTGLGLAIVKKSVDQHGGSIEVDSAPGRGTRFVVRVPFEPAPPASDVTATATAEKTERETPQGETG